MTTDPAATADWLQAAEIFRLLVLAMMLAAVMYYELREGIIPNIITFPGLVVGVVMAVVVAGLPGLKSSATGVLVGGGSFMVLYLAGISMKKPIMGAGDVKLMAAIGSFLGPWGALFSIYYGLWVGGIVAFSIVAWCFVRGIEFPKALAFGACLAVGTIYYLLASGLGFGLFSTHPGG